MAALNSTFIMNVLILVFLAFTLPYAALWHNKSAGADREDRAPGEKPHARDEHELTRK